MTVTAVATPKLPGSPFPSHEMLRKTYTRIAKAAMQAGTAKQLKKAPVAHPEKYPSYVMDPKKLGSSQKVYVIKGDLYLASTPVTLHPKTTWFKVGPAPLF